MKTETLYENVCTMIKAYSDMSYDKAGDDVIRNPHKYTQYNNPFYKSASNMLIDIRAEMDKQHQKSKGRNATVISAVKRIIANTPPHIREELRGMYEQNGRYCVTDGYRAVRLNEDITSLPHATCGDTFKLEPIFADLLKDEKIALPEVPEVKQNMVELKINFVNKGKMIYNLTDDVWVDAKYLIDILQALPNAVAYKPKNNASPIYFEAENGDAVLLPVRKV